jgi:hypothetical protein
MSGWDSLVQGYGLGRQMVNDYQNAQKKSEIADLSKEQDSKIYTDEQSQQLEAIANAKDQDGNPLYKLEAAPDGSYQVSQTAPGADGQPVAPATIAAGGTSFLGKTYDKPLTDTQRSAAKQLAMAGIMDKHGDTEGGMRFRDNALALQRGEKADAQNDQRFAWDKSRNERDIRQGDQAEKDQQTLRDVDSKTADWFKSKLTNPDGTQRAATIDDHLAASQFRAGALTEAGKVGEAGKVMAEHNTQSLVKIQLEGAQRDQDLGKTAAALNAGDLGAVKDFYNKYVPDGAKVTNVTRDAKGQINIERESLDGQKMPPTVLKDTGQMVAALASFKDPMALYQWSQNEFRNNLALRQDSREGARLGLAQDAASTGKKDTQALRDAGVAYEKARQTGDNEGMKKATLDLIQAGGVSPGAASSNAPAEVKLAQAMVSAGMAPDMRSGLEMAISKKGMSGDEIHNGFVSAGIKNMSSAADSVTKADEAMKAMGYTKANGRWSSAPSAAPSKPASETDAQTQAKAAIAGGADKSKVNERLKSMGFKTID